MTSFSFEQGPIRPPSEAGSLLVRFTRNCPWNKCAFCPVYKHRQFSRRSLEEIKGDIEAIRNVYDELAALSRQQGHHGTISREVVHQVLNDPKRNESFKRVAAWYARGQGSVFIQDANSLIMRTSDLVEALKTMRRRIPGITRITIYGRSNTVARKGVQELKALHEAGLDRIHVGMESGSDQVLKLMRKGSTADQHIQAGKAIVQAGMTLSEYVMPGLGGRELSREHALETARVLNAVNPHYIRIRSLHIIPSTPLADMVERGVFTPMDDEETVREIRLLIENLEGIQSTLTSDHIMNLLEEVSGPFPQDKEAMLETIDHYLNMPASDRLLFRLGRRAGGLRSPYDLSDPGIRSRLEQARAELEQREGRELESILAGMSLQSL
jgi:radical SAM superfamily enzyme